LFVSLHFNYTESGKDDVFGPETYCITPFGVASSNAQGEGAASSIVPANHVELRSLFLAYKVQKSLVNSLGVPDRSVRRARFAVLRDATMPAILIEGGYMSNPDEGKDIYDANYRRQMATAIVNGILAYQKATMPPAPTPAVPGTNPPAMKSPVAKSAPPAAQSIILKYPHPKPAQSATNHPAASSPLVHP
jgi:N-acetylmuramoyl-L-alanine amidase